MAKEKINIKGRPTAAIITITVIVLIAVAIIIFGRGKTTITGEYPDNISDASLSCDNIGLSYPFFTYDKSKSKKTIINIIFSKDKIKTISISHELTYDNNIDIVGSEAHNHVAMNETFAKDGLGAGSYSANYMKSDTSMRFQLFATGPDFDNRATHKYFLLDSTNSPETPAEYKKVYEDQGFSCIINQ